MVRLVRWSDIGSETLPYLSMTARKTEAIFPAAARIWEWSDLVCLGQSTGRARFLLYSISLNPEKVVVGL